MTISKNTIVILIVVAAIAIGAYLYSKRSGNLSTPDIGASQYEIDDTAAYNGIIAKFKAIDPDALLWVNPLVKSLYESGASKALIGGKKSKTGALMSVLAESNANEKEGKYIDKFGAKVLWPQSFYDDVWANEFGQFRIKYESSL